MYQLATQSNVSELLTYFEKDLTNCLYSYIDLKKYGIQNENLQIYYTKSEGLLTGVATKYYNGLQLYHYNNEIPVEDTLALIHQLNPAIISSTLDVIHVLSPSLHPQYEREEGFVTSLSDTLSSVPAYCVEQAHMEDLEEISRLICMDEGLGGHYTIAQLQEQLASRLNEKFGRNYIIRENGNIICHAATYAEVDNLAVISGVITHPDYRGKGLALNLVKTLCDDLLKEGKRPHLFYYTESAKHLYQKIGFLQSNGWGKLARLK